MTDAGPPRPWENLYPTHLRNYQFDLTPGPDHPADILTLAAERFGALPAFTVAHLDGTTESLSFVEAVRLSDAFAGYLESVLHLSAGDVVAVKLPNGLAFPIVVFGAWKAGLIVTPVNPFYTADETIHQIRDSGAKVIVTEGTMADNLKGNLVELAVVLADGASFPNRTSAPFGNGFTGESLDGKHGRHALVTALASKEIPSGRRSTIALYQYTGGTTGRSKGAVITAANLLATAVIIRDFFNGFGAPIEQGTALTALPLYHIFAFLFGMLVYVEAGTQNVIVPLARPVANLQPAFKRFKIDWMAGVDTLYAGLLAEPWFRETPPRLRFAIAGGAALRPSVAAEWEKLVGPILEGYGLTETTGIVSCNPPTAARRSGSIGLPVPGTDIRIVDKQGCEVPMGESGELLVRGAQVAAGYHAGEAELAKSFDGGWLRTGDVAAFDASGMLVLRDRTKDMVLVSGFNVYPNEVEAVLTSHPGVAEAAVIGVPDDRTGESVKAFVVLRNPRPSIAELDRHCRASLAAYKVPREFVARAELPKSAVGKILRVALRGEFGNSEASRR
ncbi:long-chain-fatty-acid--CoA ligase [Sphingomonas glacialis]|uniref:Long-chain-fatty-acid--CoA ligase n=1 Tax=Sphingomonas glacialis TaxID=658225 RepID=A0ABQ3LU77_9SPHN|nr:AMP-binding protein [Sphingomonas glacialis]GHH26224.1 long-chain-fatty-acid--CoA ligase [Sphingomonas glacialis]